MVIEHQHFNIVKHWQGFMQSRQVADLCKTAIAKDSPQILHVLINQTRVHLDFKDLFMDAIIRAKFKSLDVLLPYLNRISIRDWLGLVEMASSKGCHTTLKSLLLSPILSTIHSSDVISQGWKRAVFLSIEKGRVDVVRFLISIRKDLGLEFVRLDVFLTHAVYEGSTHILWELLDMIPLNHELQKSESPRAQACTFLLTYYATSYETDSSLTLPSSGIKNLLKKDTKGILPILKGLVSRGGIIPNGRVFVSLLLMTVTWNLSASFDYFVDYFGDGFNITLQEHGQQILDGLLRMKDYISAQQDELNYQQSLLEEEEEMNQNFSNSSNNHDIFKLPGPLLLKRFCRLIKVNHVSSECSCPDVLSKCQYCEQCHENVNWNNDVSLKLKHKFVDVLQFLLNGEGMRPKIKH
jgi:hypothetical protein